MELVASTLSLSRSESYSALIMVTTSADGDGGVAVGGTGVAVGGTDVAVGGTGVAVGGTGVAVGGTGVAVGADRDRAGAGLGVGVMVGVAVGRGVDVGVGVGVGVAVGGGITSMAPLVAISTYPPSGQLPNILNSYAPPTAGAMRVIEPSVAPSRYRKVVGASLDSVTR
jgi:hypothetical protein